MTFCSCSVCRAAMIRPTSEPVAIRITSGLPFGASARTYAPWRKPSAAGTLAAIERRHVLTGQNQCDGTVARFQRDPPSDSRLVGVARTDDRKTWNRAQAGELLHRLMGGSVLPQGDAVVGKYIDHVELHHRGEADRRPHVVGENQKCRAERHGATVRRQTIQDRPHAVLAYAEIEIAAGVAPDAIHRALLVGYGHSGGLEISQPRKCGMGRWIQIRRTADQCRQSRRNGIHYLPCGNASGHALFIRRESRNIPIPSIRQFAVHDLLKRFRQIRKRAAVR